MKASMTKVTLTRKGEYYLISKIDGQVLIYHSLPSVTSRAGDTITEKEANSINEIYHVIVKGA